MRDSEIFRWETQQECSKKNSKRQNDNEYIEELRREVSKNHYILFDDVVKVFNEFQFE